MAIDAYLRLDTITGESQVADFKGQMLMQNFSFEVDNPTSIGSATTGAGAGKVKFNALKITKEVDSASPQLFAACCSGAHIATGTLSLVKPTGIGLAARGGYVTFDMKVIFITDIVTSIEEHILPKEVVSLVFGSLLYTYKTQSENGVLTTASAKGWSILTNSAL
jgi:type VI secretion system secreted protein Hcp